MISQEGCIYIAGVDEVGRGPLAGPVVTAAVILREPVPGVTDSKKLSHIQRQRYAARIKESAICFAYGRAEVEEIDQLNIHFATLSAMQRAILGLSITPTKVLVDGLFAPDIDIPCETIVKGDLYIAEISAASILAKVYRDEEMELMDRHYPGYGFAAHKGYPTKAHKLALQTLGPCQIHRKSFAPVAALLGSVDI